MPRARPLYRVRQFLRAVTARVRPEEWTLVGRTLTPEGVRLFRGMPMADQRHSLAILHTLRVQGYEDQALWAAALLHDVAKSGGVRLWHRVPVVLIRALNPRWLARLARSDPRSWRYAFILALEHPQRGAKMAQSIGCSPNTVELIRRHEEKPPAPPCSRLDEWLVALRAADDEN